MTTPLSNLQGAVRLTDWGLIRACGADAASFLHGQLTSDIAGLDAAHSRLAGYCSAKGRLLASFVVWKAADDELLLACSADLLAATLARLRMFVLRARCVLSDASAELPLIGLAGAAARDALGAAAPAAVGDKRGDGAVTAIRLPDAAGVPRYLCAGGDFVRTALPPLAPEAWRWLEVGSGVARIVRATAEQFVPQMLNYEVVGGVDFGKGCYPGQEVVARSQYRGSNKRRSLLFEIDDAQAAPGMEVFHSDAAAQPAGMVVNAAAQPAGVGSLALVEIKLAALSGGSLHLADAGGAPLRRVELPYALPLDAEATAQ